ncbi:MAG: hypothetical protein VX320_06665 [Candidatus Thermoplasmatota archaeon]|nr:hypothetical protein [Candidatus Thermoplasmatota archaeon]
MQVLPSIEGCVHLSVEAGCGGTTFALQIARDILLQNAHVIWVCNEMPDGGRMSQIFSEAPPTAVSKLHVAAVGENISQGILSAMGLMLELDSLGLIVVDDWAPKSGKVPVDSSSKINEIIQLSQSRNVPLLLISAAYEDASGVSGWKSRGTVDADTWFLHISDLGLSMRDLNIGEEIIQFKLKDDGFIRHK